MAISKEKRIVEALILIKKHWLAVDVKYNRTVPILVDPYNDDIYRMRWLILGESEVARALYVLIYNHVKDYARVMLCEEDTGMSLEEAESIYYQHFGVE